MSEATPTIPTFIQIPPPNPPTTFDPKGVIEAGCGIVPKDGKGFVPLTDFPPTKPYDDWSGFLDKKNQQLEEERVRLRNDDPVTKLENENEALKNRKKELENRHETDLNQRVIDLEEYLKRRHDDLVKFHADELRLNDYGKDDLKTRVATLEGVRNTLEARIIADNDQHFSDLRNQYEARMADLRGHNEVLRQVYETSLAQSKEMTTIIQETIQARENGIKVKTFLSDNWDGWNWKLTVSVVVLSCAGIATGIATGLICKSTGIGVSVGFAVSAILVNLFCISQKSV